MNETWKPIAGWEDEYEVSSLGAIRNSRNGHVLGQWLAGKGYPAVGLSRSGKTKSYNVHKLVCIAFHGEQPSPKSQVMHRNNVKTDNRAENLEWGTAKRNNLDVVKSGHHTNANKTHCPKGHSYDDAYTYRRRDRDVNTRVCRACAHDKAVKAWANRKR